MKKNWNHPVIKYLRLLEYKERKKCRRFILAHSEEDTTQIISLWEYLYFSLKASADHQFDPQVVYKKVFKTNGFSQKKLSKIAYKLKCIIIDYMSYSEFKLSQNSIQQQAFFAKNLLRRKQYDLHQSEIKKIASSFSKKPPSDSNALLASAQNHEEFLFQTLGNKDYLDIPEIEAMSIKYYEFFVLKNLMVAAELSTRQLYISESYSLPVIEECLNYAKKNNVPLIIKCFGLVIRMNQNFILGNKEKSFAIYLKSKKLLKMNLYNLNAEQRMHICTLLRNYLVRYYKLKDNSILPEIFELNKFAVDYKIFVENSHMTYSSFATVFNTALLLKRIDYAKNFLESHIDLIDVNTREAVQLFCQANLHYVNKEHDKIEPLINKLSFIDWKFYTMMNLVILKSLFKKFKEKPSLILDRIDFLTIKLKTSKKVNREQAEFKSFLTILKKLLKMKKKYGNLQGVLDDDVSKLKKILDSINNLKNLSVKSWLKMVADS